MKFEYKTDVPLDSSVLNDLGDSGWRLVHAGYNHEGVVRGVMERKKQENHSESDDGN
jgi:hypothetical protein